MNSIVLQTCMADTGVVYFYANLVRFWCFHLDIFDRKVFACLPSYSSLDDVSRMPPCFH